MMGLVSYATHIQQQNINKLSKRRRIWQGILVFQDEIWWNYSKLRAKRAGDTIYASTVLAQLLELISSSSFLGCDGPKLREYPVFQGQREVKYTWWSLKWWNSGSETPCVAVILCISKQIAKQSPSWEILKSRNWCLITQIFSQRSSNSDEISINYPKVTVNIGHFLMIYARSK